MKKTYTFNDKFPNSLHLRASLRYNLQEHVKSMADNKPKSFGQMAYIVGTPKKKCLIVEIAIRK